MKLKNGFKLLAISIAAVCCVSPASAQMITAEATGTIDTLQGGGWGAYGGNSNIGQSVTLDFLFDANSISSSINGNLSVASAPITSASIVGGAFGSGINLQSNGAGIIIDQNNLTDGTFTSTATTSANAPSKGFSGTVFGFSYFTDGVNTTLDIVRNAFSNGMRDAVDSGTAMLSNVNLGESVTGPGQAPEIDPTSALSALALLMGGLAVIRGRKSGQLQSA